MRKTVSRMHDDQKINVHYEHDSDDSHSMINESYSKFQIQGVIVLQKKSFSSLITKGVFVLW